MKVKWFVFLLLPVLLLACGGSDRVEEDTAVPNAQIFPTLYMFYTDN